MLCKKNKKKKKQALKLDKEAANEYADDKLCFIGGLLPDEWQQCGMQAPKLLNSCNASSLLPPPLHPYHSHYQVNQ